MTNSPAPSSPAPSKISSTRGMSAVPPSREALIAQIAILQNLLKNIGADQLIENIVLIDRSGRAFQSLLNPATPLRVGNVNELRAHRPAIGTASLFGELALDHQVGMKLRTKETQRVEVGFEIPQRRNASKVRSRSESGAVHKASCGASRRSSVVLLDGHIRQFLG